MSDVDLPEINPDDEPGDNLREALTGSDADRVDVNGNINDDDPDL